MAQLSGNAPATTATTAAGAEPAAGALAGAPAFSYAGAYGGIPQVPSPQATQSAVLGGNLTNLPQAQQLASQVNTFNNQQAVAPYIANLPNYQNLLGQTSGNALALAQGQLPPDVVQAIQQQAAERGVMTGSPGSPNANAALLKALGLTSLQAQQTGLSQFGSLMGLTPTGPLFNPASMFVTPEQQQAAQAAANLYASAPIPAQKAAADLAALRSGVGAGQGSVATNPLTQAMNTPIASSSRGIPTAPTYAGARPQPIAPGRMSDPNAYATQTTSGQPDYPGADASLEDIYAWLGVPSDGGDTFAGSSDYGTVPGFESVTPTDEYY